MATPEHEDPVEALGPRRPHKAFRDRVRPRRADGGLDDFGTFRSEDLVETGGELRVPVPDEELHRATCLDQVGGQLPGGLGDKADARVFGDAKEMGLPGGVLDDEEDIEALEQHRVNGEEVRRQDPFRLAFEELCPARASPGCRPQAMAAKDASDRRRTHPDSELAQLALDAHTTPAAVLAAEAYDQLHQLRAHRRPSQASLPLPRSPLAPSGLSVPTQQRGRCDQESLPALTSEEPAEGGQDGAVYPSVPDAGMKLGLKDPHLVTQDHKLHVLVRFATPGRGHERQSPAQPEVHERKGHPP